MVRIRLNPWYFEDSQYTKVKAEVFLVAVWIQDPKGMTSWAFSPLKSSLGIYFFNCQHLMYKTKKQTSWKLSSLHFRFHVCNYQRTYGPSYWFFNEYFLFQGQNIFSGIINHISKSSLCFDGLYFIWSLMHFKSIEFFCLCIPRYDA